MRKQLAFALLVATAALQSAAPPYYVIVADSGGRLHASLGHAFRWAPPSPDDACAAIRSRQVHAAAGELVECPPSGARRAQFQTSVNHVRAGVESAASVVVAVVLAFARWPRRGET